MNEKTKSPDRDDFARLAASIESMQRRVGRLTVSVSILTLMSILTFAAVMGNLVNYFAGDVLMWGGATTGVAIVGFIVGWFARRRE